MSNFEELVKNREHMEKTKKNMTVISKYYVSILNKKGVKYSIYRGLIRKVWKLGSKTYFYYEKRNKELTNAVTVMGAL